MLLLQPFVLLTVRSFDSLCVLVMKKSFSLLQDFGVLPIGLLQRPKVSRCFELRSASMLPASSAFVPVIGELLYSIAHIDLRWIHSARG